MINTVLMEEMTWKEIEAAVKGGKDTALVVAASVEQHGPHLPTATDTLIGQALAQAVAERLANALVAPVIRPALSRHHLDFPGTLTLRLHTFVKVLEDYGLCLRRHGFQKAVFFVSHGGNADALKAFTPGIAKKLQPDLRVLYVYPLEKNVASLHAFLLEKGVSRGRAGVHAGYIETSLMLFLRPDLVDMSQARPGLTDERFYQPENLQQSKLSSFVHGIRSQSENGILGDPTGGSAEMGRIVFQRKVDEIVIAIKENL